jgi:hypothetical protein
MLNESKPTKSRTSEGTGAIQAQPVSRNQSSLALMAQAFDAQAFAEQLSRLQVSLCEANASAEYVFVRPQQRLD